MRMKDWFKLSAPLIPAVFCLAYALAAVPPVPETIVATIDATKTGEPVSKYEYGMFIEHLGSLIYRSLWSEMLDDRKFYYPISSKEPAATQTGPLRRFMPRQWRPVGPDEVVVMDRDRPFVGEQSPRIELDPSTSHGIQQSGLALVKGKRYIGHIVLRGSSGAKVNVSLIWGQPASDRQTVAFSALPSTYRGFPLSFTAKADSGNGTLEITGTGSGNFHVGTVSLMPADNIRGFRPDTIALLRQLHSGFWRLPGGNFISNFNWYDSVGDRDRRPPDFDNAWHAVQPNDVGMDEFMTLCKLIGAEPYITVNAGFGDAHSAAEEVEYMNGSVNARLGTMRARNGHPEPYHVKFWDIGNEPYGTWQLGRTDLKYYVLKHNEFARAMRAADPSITLLASGAMPDEMTVTGITRAMHLDNLQAQFGSDADWTGGLLAHCWGNFDGLTEHWYARAGFRFDLEQAKTATPKPGVETGYVPADETVLEWMRHPSNRVREKAEGWQEYERRFPAMIDKKIFLSIDEYAYTGTPQNLKLALAYAMVFNEMLRHTDFLRMSAFTMGVSTLDYNQTAAVLNTNGLLFKLYGDHMGAGLLPVEVSGNSPQPPPKYPVGGDQPRTNSGSPTYPLDVVAALTPDRKYLTVAVVNATESVQPFDLNVTGVRLAGKSTLWQMTGKDLDAANRVGQEPEVGVKEIDIGDVPSTLSVAPISVNIYRFPVG
ncbi:MAG TPA: alpha-L-arabinofuranosidase C-terminal domain-containing protein [Terriglobia bacterium]|nr:alpha-L-arabinofuranosidase C-terminal domain-containing protein [Terriglobia bacterium]